MLKLTLNITKLFVEVSSIVFGDNVVFIEKSSFVGFEVKFVFVEDVSAVAFLFNVFLEELFFEEVFDEDPFVEEVFVVMFVDVLVLVEMFVTAD